MKISISLIAVPLFLIASASHAAQGFYGAIGGGLLEFDDGQDQVKPKQLLYRLGYNFNDYVGIGYEGGFSLIDDEAFGVDFEVDTTFIFFKLGLPISDTGSVYLVTGPTDVELTGSSGGFSASADDEDTGLGFGFETQLQNSRFFVDYITYYDDDGADVTSLNFGVAFGF